MAGIRAMGTSLTLKMAGSETADTVVANLTSIGEIGLENEEIDVTTLDSPNGAKEYISGAADAGTLEIAGNVVTLEAMDVLYELAKNRSIRTWEIEIPNIAGATPATLGKFTVQGYIASWKTAEATPDGLVGFSSGIRVSGIPTFTPTV